MIFFIDNVKKLDTVVVALALGSISQLHQNPYFDSDFSIRPLVNIQHSYWSVDWGNQQQQSSLLLVVESHCLPGAVCLSLVNASPPPWFVKVTLSPILPTSYGLIYLIYEFWPSSQPYMASYIRCGRPANHIWPHIWGLAILPTCL